MRPLVVPPAALRDEDSVQMLSAWIAERGLHCTMNVGMWSASGVPEPDAWGKLLADVARHIGNAMHEQSSADASEVVDAVSQAFLKELGRPTSGAQGEFRERPH
ncbi:MAG: DUF5076 domain-containing protein [Polaromonas sp.]|nr:DUF5076 domain-containing protein [Polaromonas sp.]